MGFLYVLRSIIALVVVIWSVNVVLKYLNQYTSKQTKSIEIIERVSVSKSSSLAIVKVLNQYYLMNFSENSSEMIREFTEEQTEEIEKIFSEQEDGEPSEFFKGFNFKELKEKYLSFFNQKK